MTLQTVNTGTDDNDGTGDNLRVAFDKINENFEEIDALQSRTLNAAAFPGATNEEKIQSAINQAVANGDERVRVPSDMLDYDATAIAFNTAVQMVREGGDDSVYDVWAYGARGDGVTDDTVAVQAAIDAVATMGGGRVFFPSVVEDYIVNGGLTIGPTRGAITLSGDGGGGSAGTKQTSIRRASGTTTLLTAAGTSGSYIQRVNIRDLYLSGGDTTGTVVDFQYITTTVFDRCFFGHCIGRAIRMRNFQDSRFNDCEIEWAGSVADTLAAVSFEDDNSATFNCNQVYFDGCRWETNIYSNLLIQGRAAAKAFNINITRSKLESVRVMTKPIDIQHAVDCHFTDVIITVLGAANNAIDDMIACTSTDNLHLTNVTVQATSSAAFNNALTLASAARQTHLSGFLAEGTINTSVVSVEDTSSSVWIEGTFGVPVGNATTPTPVARSGGALLGQVHYLAVNGAHLLGDVTVGDGTGARLFTVDGAAGQVRDISWSTAASRRWVARANAIAEGGANAGSNWQLVSRDDSGNLLAIVMEATRSNSLVTFIGDIVAAGGYRQTIDGWIQDNVVANQTNVELVRADGRFAAPRAGSVTAVTVRSTEARTAGTLTVTVFKNTGLAGAAGSTIGLTAVLDGTNTSKKATTQAKDTDTFAANDEIYAVVTTDAGWLPVTADIRVAIEVET